MASCLSLNSEGAFASSGYAPQCIGKSETYTLINITRTPFAASALRCGSGATHNYGWNKIYVKHGIHLYSVVQGAAIYGVDKSTTADKAMSRYVYERRFIEDAAPYRNIVVRAVVDRAVTIPGGGILGINTTYCVGLTLCPTWINAPTTQANP